ncbi:hypothetical protein VIBC2010_00874 [Vibrio caribbeanicus ATCC BAA-2122]|uniref:Uncharacterized protein n=1 Tax=Vibrio caribbeanicus ATCC BAA-2122 TaxID=796620 RepID=E3BGJ6_9VIBR|nr:hypothetical protein VIBC2010_00874 [Vibrio caribbeanicus ATCC BAA-2122]
MSLTLGSLSEGNGEILEVKFVSTGFVVISGIVLVNL